MENDCSFEDLFIEELSICLCLDHSRRKTFYRNYDQSSKRALAKPLNNQDFIYVSWENLKLFFKLLFSSFHFFIIHESFITTLKETFLDSKISAEIKNMTCNECLPIEDCCEACVVTEEILRLKGLRNMLKRFLKAQLTNLFHTFEASLSR